MLCIYLLCECTYQNCSPSKPECLAVMLKYFFIPWLSSSSKTKTKNNIIMTFGRSYWSDLEFSNHPSSSSSSADLPAIQHTCSNSGVCLKFLTEIKHKDVLRCVDGREILSRMRCRVVLVEVSHSTKRCASMCRCFWVQGELWIPAVSHLGWRQLRTYVSFASF